MICCVFDRADQGIVEVLIYVREPTITGQKPQQQQQKTWLTEVDSTDTMNLPKEMLKEPVPFGW